MISVTPLIQHTFAMDGSVLKIEDSPVLQGHFGQDLSIVPLVALKAHTFLESNIGAWTCVEVDIKSAVLPGMSVRDIGQSLGGHMTRTEDIIAGIVPLSREWLNSEEGTSNPLFIPQRWSFRLADYGEVAEDGTIFGYYRVSSEFPWHNNHDRMDPFILEEVAAQIATYGYASRMGVQAREHEDAELNAKFPLLTFETSKVVYHTDDMPYIAHQPKLILAGKMIRDDDRKAEIIYTLYSQFNDFEPLPVISGEISTYKGTIGVVKRSVRRYVQKWLN